MDISTPHIEHTPASFPEKRGIFERWLKKRRKPEAEGVATRTEHFGAHIMWLLKQHEQTTLGMSKNPTERSEMRINDTINTTRALGETTLGFVHDLIVRENAPMKEAETDLDTALHELNDTAINRREKTLDSTNRHEGEYDRFTSPVVMRDMPDVMARITEKTSMLEVKERAKQAITTAGIGILAVGATLITAIDMYQAAKERRQYEHDLLTDKKFLTATRAQLYEQQQALQHLQSVRAAKPSAKNHHYQVINNFTHRQAAITREVTRDIRLDVAGLPQGVEQIRPVAVVERADRIERTRQQHNFSEAAVTREVVPVLRDDMAQDVVVQPPITNTVLMRQQAHRKAAQLRRMQYTWLVGLVLLTVIIVLVTIAVVF